MSEIPSWLYGSCFVSDVDASLAAVGLVGFVADSLVEIELAFPSISRGLRVFWLFLLCGILGILLGRVCN